MNAPDIKAIFVDVDWTIVSHSPKKGPIIDTYSLYALEAMQKKGIKVYLCTGRTYHTIEQLGLSRYFTPDGIIAVNGGLIYEDGKVVYSDPIPKESLETLVKESLAAGLTMRCATPKKAFLIAPKTNEVDYVNMIFPEPVPEVEDYHGQEVIQATIYGRSANDWWFMPKLPKDLHFERFHDCAFYAYHHRFNKGGAVDFVLAKHGWKRHQAMAFGDDICDIDMFKRVYYSVCLDRKNENNDVKPYAHYVARGSFYHGVKETLIHYGLYEEPKIKDNLGVLLPVASLVGRHGIGDFGPDAYRFIDWLKKENYRYWQFLPLNPLGPGNSPYMPTCSEALEYRYICLDKIKNLENVPSFRAHAETVDYEKVGAFKERWLRKSFRLYQKTGMGKLKRYIKENKWLIPYACFETFKALHNGDSWNKWAPKYRDYFQKHHQIPAKHRDEVLYRCYVQMLAHEQYDRLFAYARKQGIKLIADMPFYVGFDSVEVWLHRDQFLLDENNKQTFEGGVPPDAFSDVGQLWGSPIYDFEKMKKDDYSLLVNRVGYLATSCDLLRLDHFRAFDTYYVIPAGMPDAKIGEWKIGPRHGFFDALYKKYPNVNLIAEDLGDLFDSVLELRDDYELPGMFISEFTIFDLENLSNRRLIVYPGTHDNETLYGWLLNRKPEEIEFIKQRLNLKSSKNLFKEIFDYIRNLPSYMTIFQLQDLLKLDNKARLNEPGTVGYPNFAWKLRDWKWVNRVHFRNK